jgi:hypothetical protein
MLAPFARQAHEPVTLPSNRSAVVPPWLDTPTHLSVAGPTDERSAALAQIGRVPWTLALAGGVSCGEWEGRGALPFRVAPRTRREHDGDDWLAVVARADDGAQGDIRRPQAGGHAAQGEDLLGDSRAANGASRTIGAPRT